MILSPIKAICDKAERWSLSSLPSVKISLVEIFQPLYLAAVVGTQHGGKNERHSWGWQHGLSSPSAPFICSAVKSLNPLGSKSWLAERTVNTAWAGGSFSNCVMVHLYSLLGNFHRRRGCCSTQKSFSSHVCGRRPSCTSLYSLRSPLEGWGVSRTTSGTLQVQWVILDLGLPQGSQLKTLGNMANVPLELFPRSRRPEIVTVTSYGTETWSRIQQEGKQHTQKRWNLGNFQPIWCCSPFFFLWNVSTTNPHLSTWIRE